MADPSCNPRFISIGSVIITDVVTDEDTTRGNKKHVKVKNVELVSYINDCIKYFDNLLVFKG